MGDLMPAEQPDRQPGQPAADLLPDGLIANSVLTRWAGMEWSGADLGALKRSAAVREARDLPDLRSLELGSHELAAEQSALRARLLASTELCVALAFRAETSHPLAHLEYEGPLESIRAKKSAHQDKRTFVTLHDLFMVSARSNLRSSLAPDISSPLSPDIRAEIPFMQAPMTYISEEINNCFVEQGGFAMGHRWMSKEDTLKMIGTHPGRAIAVVGCDPVEEQFLLAKEYLKAGAVGILVDVNIAWTEKYLGLLKKISELGPDVLIAGNVDNPEAVIDLFLAGATVVKMGVGPGSHCKTRQVTPIGRPQGSNISACAYVARLLGMYSIADGGIQSGGRFATMALALNSDFVMKGRIFASTDQGKLERHFFAGDWVLSKIGRALQSFFSSSPLINGWAKMSGTRLHYYGMAEQKFQDRTMGGKKRPGQGYSSYVPQTGDLNDLLESYRDETKVGVASTGSKDLTALRKNAQFGLVTSSYQSESGHRKY